MRLAIECRVHLQLFGMPNNSICRHITLYTTLLLWPTTMRDRSIVGISWRWRWKRQKKKINPNKQNCTQSAHSKSISQSTRPTQLQITNFEKVEKKKLKKQFVRSESSKTIQQDETVWSIVCVDMCVCFWNDMRFATALHNILYDTKQQQQQQSLNNEN